MIIELFQDDRRKPVAAVTGEVATIRDRDYVTKGRDDAPARYRLSASQRRELTAQRDAAFAVLTSVADPQSLVEHRDASQRGYVTRLVVEVRGVAREIEWSYPDRLPAAVETLYRTVERAMWDLPQQHFERNVVHLVRDAAAAKTGVPADQWTVVEKSRESFDHHRSLPDADYSGAMTMEAVGGFRVTLRHGTTFVAYHAVSAKEVLFAETWQRGEFPRYAPAALDIAHKARSAGHLGKAVAALESVMATSMWSEKEQAALEIAEVYGQQGKFALAEQLFKRQLGGSSQEAHTVASCGLAWVGVLRGLAPGEVAPPPPSQWAELGLHPWWRAGMPEVTGVPARYPALQAALDNGPASHHAAWEARNGQHGLSA